MAMENGPLIDDCTNQKVLLPSLYHGDVNSGKCDEFWISLLKSIDRFNSGFRKKDIISHGNNVAVLGDCNSILGSQDQNY